MRIQQTKPFKKQVWMGTDRKYFSVDTGNQVFTAIQNEILGVGYSMSEAINNCLKIIYERSRNPQV